MTEHLLPLVYLNMGAEMMYILDQRLRNIDGEKTPRVLKEITCAILSKKTVEEVFKAKRLPSKKSLKILFEKLAHSSIMRLNENSMDKLFDLMTMTTKYCMQQVVCAEQVMTVTANHLQGMLNIMPEDRDVCELVEHAFTMTFTLYRSLTPCDWHLLRCGILAYFQGTRVKISMLLRENKQDGDGHFYWHKLGDTVTLPKDGEPPGTIKYYTSGSVFNTTEFPVFYQYVEFVPKPDQLNSAERSTKIGQNMYKHVENIEIQGGGGTAKREEHEGNELAFLESLYASRVADDTVVENWDLSMFNDVKEESNYVEESKVLKIDASKKKKTVSAMMNEMKLERPGTAKKTSKGKGRDLLDMMDEAAADEEKPKARRTNSTKGKAVGERARSANRAASATPKRAKSAKRT